MQILSHLIKKKKINLFKKKKKALWDKQAFCSSLVSSIWSANPPIHHPATWLAISPTGLKAGRGKILKSTQSKLLILTGEELRSEETKAFSKNINLVAKLV